MATRFFYFLFVKMLVLTSYSGVAQVINAYAKVTAISGNVLTLSDINQTNHTFVVGEEVILMQMQGDVIGSTADDSSFGALGTIGSVGLYEVATISGKTATSLTLTNVLSNAYNVGANSSVQVISFRLLGSPDYTTSADMAALDWNGNVGGVIAIKVKGELTLNHNITANGAGFVGGSASANNSTVDCLSIWRTNVSSLAGEKGESIYKRTDANYRYGRGKMLNGGGGGNRHNAGGGGGGNFTTGGNGGPGWACSGTPVGGDGGLSLSPQISVFRIFMGGGGGGGDQNNSVATAGADGGGIILISATKIITTGTCTSRAISANGANAANTNNDGAGGGGAGGTIVLDVESFSVLSGCPLTVSANGGNGGSSVDPNIHGGGGGGGQGKVFYLFGSPSNVTTSTNNGTSGCNNNSSPCSDQAPAASGASNAGISVSAGQNPLPVSLRYFTGSYNKQDKTIALQWETASERNNAQFSISKSSDGIHFKLIKTMAGHGTTSKRNKYFYEDTTPYADDYNYYMLSQTDFNDKETVLKVIAVKRDQHDEEIVVYPMPIDKAGSFFIHAGSFPLDVRQVKLLDAFGKEVSSLEVVSKKTGYFEISVPDVPAGFYILKIISSSNVILGKKIVIR